MLTTPVSNPADRMSTVADNSESNNITYQTQEATQCSAFPLTYFAGVRLCVEIKPDVTCSCEQSLSIVVIFMSV